MIPPIPMSPLAAQNSGSQALSPRGLPPPPPPTSAPAAAVAAPAVPSIPAVPAVPSVPVVPAVPAAALQSVPPVPRTTINSDMSLPSSPPPPPPPAQAPPLIPYRNLIPAEEPGESSSEVTGYEADEDTDLNHSASIEDEFHNASSSPSVPRSAAPPPPPPPHSQSSPSLGHAKHLLSSHRVLLHHPSWSFCCSSATEINTIRQVPPESAARSPDSDVSSNRFSFRRTSSELSRSNSKRHSQANSVSSFVYEEPVELPKTIDLSGETGAWWASPEGVPRTLLNRRDVRYEVEEQALHKRSGLNVTVRDIYVLFGDLSQEVITVEFGPNIKTPSVFVNQVAAPNTPKLRHLLLHTNVMDIVY